MTEALLTPDQAALCRADTAAAPAAGSLQIVHVITRFLRAGAEENTRLTCDGQVALGHRVWLLHGNQAMPEALARLDPRVRVIAVPGLVHPLAPGRDLMALWQLCRLLRRIDADVLHSHTSKAGILGRLAARMTGVPLVLHGVHILPFQNVGPVKKRLYLGLERLVSGYTHGYIAVSEALRSANLAAGLGRAGTNHVVASGMDLTRFRNPLPPPDLPPHQGLLVMVAAFEPRKRHLEFLPVFAGLVQRHPGLKLALLGEGPLRPAVEAGVARLGLQDQVIFTGFREDVAGWIAAADLCLLCSAHEGLPRVLVQYLAAGRPVVMTALPGAEVLLQPGVNGFILPKDAVSAMSEPVHRVLSDPELAARLQAGARAVDVSPWAAEAMVAGIERVMQGAMALRRAAAARRRA